MVIPEVTVDLARHPESEANAEAEASEEPRIGGRNDGVDITELGAKQADGLANFVLERGITYTHVLHSGAVRCVRLYEAADEVLEFERRGVPVFEDPDLLEMDQGKWTDMPRSIYKEPAVVRRMEKEGMDFVAKEGESPNMVADRYLASLRRIVRIAIETQKPVHALALCHGVGTKCVLARCLGLTLDQMHKGIHIDNVSLTRLIHMGAYNEQDLWRVGFISKPTYSPDGIPDKGLTNWQRLYETIQEASA